eukprot:TRINITY_DN5679_c0_g1_i5.p1 TRINITY_DN5679_c0_g1~~TRINITY_DN5679_c0_g1_i5.p1  ORF type:complete len:330 (-),score=25.51 TRINITY_DN5679_c0_g1_i5:171-1022(-)
MSSFEIECMHREMKLLRSLKRCEGIVQVQQQLEESDGSRLVFDGQAQFLDCLATHQLFDIQDIVQGIVKPVLHGLAYLHSAGIMVRNLREETILLSGQGAVISNLFLHVDKHRNLPFDRVGQVEYMAPEVLNKPLPEDVFQMVMDYGIGENDLPTYDESSDIWCLGVFIYKLLTGFLPFEGTTPEEVAEDQRMKLKRGNRLPLPPFLNELSLPMQAKLFIWECLQIQPDNRKSAEQLLEHDWIQSLNQSNKVFPAFTAVLQVNSNEDFQPRSPRSFLNVVQEV